MLESGTRDPRTWSQPAVREAAHAAAARTDELSCLLAAQERRRLLSLSRFEVLPPRQLEARRLLQQPRAPQQPDIFSPKRGYQLIVERGEGAQLLRKELDWRLLLWCDGHLQTAVATSEQVAAIAQGGFPAVQIVAGEDEAARGNCPQHDGAALTIAADLRTLQEHSAPWGAIRGLVNIPLEPALGGDEEAAVRAREEEEVAVPWRLREVADLCVRGEPFWHDSQGTNAQNAQNAIQKNSFAGERCRGWHE